MSKALPARPHLDWYRKAAKKTLARIRAGNRAAQLADAQLAVAREHGFSSWRKLKEHIDAIQATEFFDAIRRHDVKLVRRLLTSHAELTSARTPAGQTPLHVAAEANQPQIVKLLMARGADPRAKYASSAHGALSWAVTTGAFEAAEELVRGGVAPDLFAAAGMGALDAVKSFFDANGHVHPAASHTGSSRFGPGGQRLAAPPTDPREIVSDALCFACRNRQANVVRFLLKRNPDVNFRAFLAGTPLHWAYFGGSRIVITLLLNAGADPTLRDAAFHCTPRAFGICVAANWGLVSFVKRSLRLDKSLVQIHEGRGTPLHEAARAGEIEIVRILLRAGAVPSVRDADGRTPLDLAESQHHDDVATLLRSLTSH
jgi:ankyrin repeat protein